MYSETYSKTRVDNPVNKGQMLTGRQERLKDRAHASRCTSDSVEGAPVWVLCPDLRKLMLASSGITPHFLQTTISTAGIAIEAIFQGIRLVIILVIVFSRIEGTSSNYLSGNRLL